MSAARRLMKEWSDQCKDPTPGIVAGPLREDDLFVWSFSVTGPEDSPYAYGVFQGILEFPQNYPMSPPVMTFTTPISHPNVYGSGPRKGEVCISILHSNIQQSFGYDKVEEIWSATQTVNSILLSVMSMLAEPNVESPADVEIAKIYISDRQRFNKIVQRQVEASLGL